MRGVAASQRAALPDWTRRQGAQHASAYLLYLLASVLLFGRGAVAHPDTVCACIGTEDPAAHMWSLVWWPHAVAEGLNPLRPDVIWTPDGVNLAHSGAAIPAWAFVLAPVTLTAGPLVAYNVASLLSPVLAASFAYLLCRYVTRAFGPALVGGFVFGFGTYMAAHLLGHLTLVGIFPVPALVYLVLRRLDDDISTRRFVVLGAASFVLLLLLSPEVLLTGLGFGALALLLAYATNPSARARLRRLVVPLLAAGGVAMVVTSPFLYGVFDGLGDADKQAWRTFTDLYRADALNVVVPTEVTGLGHQWFRGMSSDFTYRSPAEAASYIGLALLVITVAFAISSRRRPAARVLVPVIVVSYVLSLGSHLDIAGHSTDIPLPWKLLHPLPVFDHIMPPRLFMYGMLAIAISTALWLAQRSARSGLKWALAALAVLMLVPNVSADFWDGRPTNPAFFSSDLYKRHLKSDEVVLVLPYGRTGNSMLWQAETNMYFRMPGGYVSPEYPLDYRSDPFLGELLSGQVGDSSVAGLRDFLGRRNVTAVVVESGSAGPWPLLLGGLGLKPVRTGGVLLYRVPQRLSL
jgi:hypothetical protein